MESDSMAIKTGSSLGSLIGTVTKTYTKRIDGTMKASMGEAFVETIHSSTEASNAKATHMVTDQLDG
ncbi:hypothetical protein V6N13_029779 [Hibiscus sabdariffa]